MLQLTTATTNGNKVTIPHSNVCLALEKWGEEEFETPLYGSLLLNRC